MEDRMTGLEHTEPTRDHGLLNEGSLEQAQSCSHFNYRRDRDGGFCPDCGEYMLDSNN